MIGLNKIYEIDFVDCEFSGNWVLDLKDEIINEKATLMVFKDTYALTHFQDCSFANHHGINNSNLEDNFGIDFQIITGNSLDNSIYF